MVENRVICSAFRERKCVNTNESILFTLTFFDTNTKEYKDIVITARVIDSLQGELVVGLQTLGRYGLLAKLLPRLGENRDCTRRQVDMNGDKGGVAMHDPTLPTHKAGVQRTQLQRTRGGHSQGKGCIPNRSEQPVLDGCEMCALLMRSMSEFLRES